MKTVEQITGEIEQRQRQLEGFKCDLESKQQQAGVIIEQRKSHLLRASKESQRLAAQHLCKRNFELLAQEVRIYCADLRELQLPFSCRCEQCTHGYSSFRAQSLSETEKALRW